MVLIKFRKIGSPDLAARELRKYLREVWRMAGERWHQTMRPQHFTRAGARKYGYLPRAGERGNERRNFRSSYTGRKLRRFGHTNPLVYTGLSMALTRPRDVRATAKGVRVVMNSPGFNRRNPRSRINMREELTRVTEEEANLLARLMEERLVQMLAGCRVTTVEG